MTQILIIEDDQTLNNVLANFLRKEGYQVFSAYTLTQGREFFAPHIGLIVLDLNLPDGNGFDFLQELRKTSNVPVIVLTAINDEISQLNAFDLQADEYVDKPVSPLVMTKRIQALINRLYGSNKKITILGFIIDFEKHQILNNKNEEVSLTAKEFNIVSLLYNRKGATVPRESILESVWGFEYAYEIRLLDSHIKNIRRKLCPELIITVKNIGYRLNL